MRSALLRYAAEKYQGDELIRSVEKYQDAYTAVEKTKTVSAAMGEMMNDAMSGIFSSKEGIHDLSEWLDRKQGVKEQKSVLGTLADHFRGIETAMRNLLNRGTLTSSGRHAAMIAEKNASKIRKMILDEMDVAIENAAKANVVEGVGENKVFSLKQQEKTKLRDRINLVMQGRNFENDMVFLRNTPKILIDEIGLEDIPMAMTSNHVYSDIVSREEAIRNGRFKEKVNYHDLGKYGFIHAIDNLDDPIIIVKSRNEDANTDIVAVTDTIDKNGNTVLAAIRVGKEGNISGTRTYINDIGSVYGKKNTIIGYIENAYSKGRILYLNKIKARNENAPGFQLPDRILNTGFKSNVEHYRDIVNKKRINKQNQNTIASQRKAENDISNKINDLPEERHFSLDVDEPVQQTKDLIAVHNLNEENLRFSINISDAEKKQILNEEKRLQKQIDNWNGIDESIHFEVAKTPDILKNKLNFESLSIEIDSSKVKKISVQKITSTYAKENAQHILDQSDIEYVNQDKKITISWQKLTRLQLPFVNLNAGGYNNTLSHSANISNNIQTPGL